MIVLIVLTMIRLHRPQGEVPGAIAILVKDGKIGYPIRAFGWADIAGKKPLETDSLVRIASMSKLVTTVAALQLYEKANSICTPSLDRSFEVKNQQFSRLGTRKNRRLSALNLRKKRSR